MDSKKRPEADRVSSTLAALLVLIFAFFCDGFLYGIIVPLTPFTPANITDPWTLGLVYGSYAVGVILATLFFGFLSDRLGKRKSILILSAIFQFISVIAFAKATNVPILIFARLAQGISGAIIWTVGLAVIAEEYPENRGQKLGYAMLGDVIGLIVGPSVGGFILESFGYLSVFWVTGALVLAQCILFVIFLKDSGVQKTNETEFFSLITDRTVLRIGVLVILGAWCWSEMEALVPEHLEHNYHASAILIGFIFTISNISYGFCCPLVSYVSDRFGSWKTTALGLFAMSLLMMMMAFFQDVLESGVLLAFIGLAYGFALNPPLAELATRVEEKGSSAYSSVYVIYNIAFSIGMMGSTVSAGAIASRYSYEMALFSTSFIIIAFLMIGLAYFYVAKNPVKRTQFT